MSTARTRRLAASPPSLVWVSVSTGTNADDMEPSANNSRRRLGMRNATKKTSDLAEAPKYPARIISLMYPSIRLMSVAADMTPAARAILPCALNDNPGLSALHRPRIPDVLRVLTNRPVTRKESGTRYVQHRPLRPSFFIAIRSRYPVLAGNV